MRLSAFAAFVFISFASAVHANGIIFVGPDVSSSPQPPVVRFDTTPTIPLGGPVVAPPYTSGVRVAAGDFSLDGTPDVIVAEGAAAFPSGSTFVAIDGTSGFPLFGAAPFGAAYTGGLFVGVGDINGDGIADKAIGADLGAPPHAVALNGSTGAPVLPGFFAYARSCARCSRSSDLHRRHIRSRGRSGNFADSGAEQRTAPARRLRRRVGCDAPLETPRRRRSHEGPGRMNQLRADIGRAPARARGTRLGKRFYATGSRSASASSKKLSICLTALTSS